MEMTLNEAKEYLKQTTRIRPNDGFVVRYFNELTDEGYVAMGESRNGRAGVKAGTVIKGIEKIEEKARRVAQGRTFGADWSDFICDNDTGSGTKIKGPGHPSRFPNGTESYIKVEIYQFDKNQDYYENKTKRGSLVLVFQQRVLTEAIDSNFNFYKNIDLSNFINRPNVFQ